MAQASFSALDNPYGSSDPYGDLFSTLSSFSTPKPIDTSGLPNAAAQESGGFNLPAPTTPATPSAAANSTYFSPVAGKTTFSAQSQGNANNAAAAGHPVNLPITSAPLQSGPPSLIPGDAASRQAFISYWAKQPGANPSLTNDPGYWDQEIASGRLGTDSNYIISKFMLPEGAPAGSLTAGVDASMFDDPATQMFQKMVLSRMDQLLQSVSRPEVDQYKAAAQKQVDQLNAPPYSAADEQALITQMREPLTQARDAATAQAKERLGARNIGPSSGLFQDQVYSQPNADYQRALATGTNDLAVQGIQTAQQRKQQALDTLANLVTLGQTTRNEDNTRAQEALTTGAILPDMSERRLQLILQSLGYSSQQIPSLMSSLTSLMSLNQNQSQFQTGQDNQNAAAIGELIGSLINSPLLNGSGS